MSFFICGLSNSLAQDVSPWTNTSPPLRTNPEDVKLATLASSADTVTTDTQSSQDSWKSLTTSPNDSMTAPAPSTSIAPKNTPPSPVDEPKPKAVYKKEDYGPQTGWGVRAAMGPALQQAISARSGGGAAFTTFNFSPGFRSDFELFYNITNGFDFGMESAFIYNSISSINSSAFPANNLVSGSTDLGNAAFYQVPVFGNLRFQIPNSGKIRGYLTGGVGLAWDYLTISALGNTYSQHQWNYAFQLGAGFQYNLLSGLDLETSFKTMITPNPLIFSDGTSQVKASYNYTLEIGLAYRF